MSLFSKQSAAPPAAASKPVEAVLAISDAIIEFQKDIKAAEALYVAASTTLIESLDRIARGLKNGK